MSKIQELKEKHKAEIEALQGACSHVKSQWMPFQWAPGHYDGEVLVCEECEKILEKRNNQESFFGDREENRGKFL